MSDELTYKPRNDFVVVRVSTQDTNFAGIALPQISASAKQFHIVAFGPDVKDLSIGDRIIIVAKQGEGDYYPIPQSKDLIVLRQAYIALVVERNIQC
jgi:hypothetical protein